MRFRTLSETASPARSAFLTFVFLGLILLPGVSAQTTFTVNATDDLDDGTCDAGHCSLREAITASNLDPVGGIIHFSIPGAGPHTIQPLAALPALEDDVIIDGTSEPDFAGTPVIELDGSLAGGAHGLDIVGSQNLVRGLVINRFAWNGISINTDCTFNAIEGNYIGTDVTGTLDFGNGDAGVLIGQASDNTVGGATAAARNLISGNREGVTIVDVSATGNLVVGNYIGTDVTGILAIPNDTGVLLLAPDNTIGGTAAGSGNLISGNTGHGINLGPPNATGNLIAGNYIGVDATGTMPLGNDIGVWVDNVADNIIGGTSAGARNLISGNREGITFWDQGATGNLVQGNYVGTNATGDAAIPNGGGIPIYGPGNTVGGAETGAGNLISGNTFNGVTVYGEHGWENTVQGNLIGTNASGTAALGNGEHGLAVIFASSNTIGGTEDGAGNVLSGNGLAGVFLLGEVNEENVVLGNFIGTDLTGNAAVGNGESGVAIHSATNNIIGGTEPGAGNVISGNAFGILIGNLLATENLIQGNYIGTNAAGDAAIPNTEIGVLTWGEDNTIGGSEIGAGNVISGNTFWGIGLGEGSSGTVIQGNLIGTDATGMAALGNELGIFLTSSPDNTIGGTAPGARNVISGNRDGSITVAGVTATGNIIQGNYIGTDHTGTLAVPNDGGFWIRDAPGNTIGGTESGAGNLISGNTGGIRVDGPDASGNVIQGNTLGMDVTGTLPMSVRGAGVRFSNGASGNTLGGAQSGAGNVVANATWVGVAVFNTAGTGNLVLSNSIFDNAALGLELNRDGVTVNDEGDGDTGPNNLQNYPVLTSVASSGGAVIQASLNSTASSSFTMEFFSNPECDETGFGEGQTPLGTANLTTDASGNGTVASSFSSVTGSVFTATATDANGNTSEFSQCSDATTLGVSSSPTTRTVTPGQAATYNISVSAQGGVFEETVGLSCTGAPSGTTCAFASDELTLASGQASTNMTVTTVAPSASFLMGPRGTWSGLPGHSWAIILALASLLALMLATLIREGDHRRRRAGAPMLHRVRWSALAGLGALLLILQTACGDSGTSTPTGGTPPGTYELTVTATWESVQQTGTVTLVVQ
ncbi:MAG: CSLREA domain-containing protein [Gemmatimonadetes bacterium]|nr:CSLREA domain-containing protein [Gemmatimonadota bacterium]NNM04889.1 CSLREA domain-containing protein [Gemmatimonadota bacterium]